MEDVNKNMDSQSQVKKKDEIDLIEAAKTIWARRKLIMKVTAAFFVIGLIIAFGSKVEYESSTKLMPEGQSGTVSNLGGLSSLAGLAGIDIGNTVSNTTFPPSLYPELTNSLPFVLEVMNDTINFEQIDLSTTSFNYFKNISTPTFLDLLVNYTVGLPRILKKAMSKDNINHQNQIDDLYYRISKEDWRVIEKFRERINLDIDEVTGVISIKVEMPDPVASAQVTKIIGDKIVKNVISYNTNKASESLMFVKKAHEDAKNEFEKHQKELAIATDRNQNLSSAFAQIEMQRIQNEYNLAFEIYKGLSTQLESAKIKLKEQTPVLSILGPVRIPYEKSKPKRILIVTLSLLSGLSLATLWIIVNNYKRFIV